MYSTLALGKGREVVKEETALRKEKEAVCCYVHVDVYTCISCTRMHTIVYIYIYIYRQPQWLRKPHAHIYIQAAATA